jgi:hypothetical protein
LRALAPIKILEKKMKAEGKKYGPTLVGVYATLSPNDLEKLKDFAKAKKKKLAAMAREAIEWYLTYQIKIDKDAKETALEKRLKRMEDRIAAIHSRTAIDVGAIYSVMWQNSNFATRDEQFTRAKKYAVDKLQRSLNGDGKDIKELIAEHD